MSDLSLSEETDIAPVEVFIDGVSMTEIDLASMCEQLVDDMKRTGDTSPIENAIINLNGVQNMAARAKSKLIYEWSAYWLGLNPGGDFAEMYTQTHGGDKLSVQKHQAIGGLLVSTEVPDNVKQLPNKELLSAARALQSGYDLDEHWDEIAHAGSEQEVNEIVRKVKGKPERTGTLSISLQRDGSITGWMGDTMVSLGWLNVADRDDDDTPEDKRKVLEMGIARIVNNGRMKVK